MGPGYFLLALAGDEAESTLEAAANSDLCSG